MARLKNPPDGERFRRAWCIITALQIEYGNKKK